MNGTAQPLEKRRIAALLLFIVLTGTLFRVAGLSSGYQRVEDIPVARQIAQNYQGDWRPDFVYYYPNLFNYIVAIALRGVSAFFRLVGVQRGPGLFPFSPDEILFAARLLSALLGSATILVVYAIGRRLYSARDGLIAAFLFSVAFIPILFSHQIVLDVPMSFFYAVSLYFCVLIAQKRRWLDYALAGFLGGLTVAAKYNGVFIFAAVFLSHALTQPPVKKRIYRAFVDLKIYLAAAAGAAGFFVGHPYALLKFKTFLGASKLLLQNVHETEWFLKPIQPKTWIEIIAYNKQVLALKNILTAEGPVFLGLILLGIVAVCLRRSRRTVWLPLSGLAYYLGAVGYVGFSRFRDLTTFALFYAFLGAAGIGLLRNQGSRSPAVRHACAWLVAAAVIALEFGGWSKSYYLWEDDTTEIAERWIRRNIPETSYIGKEWFSPSLRDYEPRYRTFTRPYLFSRDFAPYSRFDYLITSSAAYGHFFKNEEFYPEHLRLYRSVRKDNERVKDFFFWDIEYKNPELNILRVGNPGRKKQRLALPLSVPWESPAKEFECIDGSPYGKSVMSFFLEGRGAVERVIISRRKIPSLAVFVSGIDRPGEVEIVHAGAATRLKVEPGETAYVIFNPRLAFPFYHHIYRICVKGARPSGSVFVRLCADEFEIGSELFRQGRWREARAYLLRALKTRPFPVWDFEIYVDLADCCRELGLAGEAERFSALAKASPFLGRYLELLTPSLDEAAWRRGFERFSGLDLELFETLQANRITAAEMERQVPPAAAAPAALASEKIMLVSEEKRLPPQRYRLRLRFANPSPIRGPLGRLETISNGSGAALRQVFPIELDGSSQAGGSSVLLSAELGEAGAPVRFVLILDKDREAPFQDIEIYPDIRDFMNRKPSPVHRPAAEMTPGTP
jgi:4-amino-4-deoxy-L-arabinose transferase-like glycosyltransferase